MRDIVVHWSGLEIDLQAPTGAGERLLRDILRREDRPRCKPGELLCQRHHGDLYLSIRGGTVVGCHWPNSGYEDEPHQVALMSTEHKVQVEYIARAAEREGLPTATEKTLPTKVRPDLVVNADTAFEVQRSHVTTREAKRRTTQAVRGGMSVSLWVSDKPPAARPTWFGEVPSVMVFAPDWKRLPNLGQATITRGLRRFFYVRHDRDYRCEWQGRCDGWHLRHEPTSQTLDRLSVGLVVGHYAPIHVGRSIQIATRADVEKYGLDQWAVAAKVSTPPRESDEASRIECRATTSTYTGPACCGERPPGELGGPVLPACQLCPQSPTYWRGAP